MPKSIAHASLVNTDNASTRAYDARTVRRSFGDSLMNNFTEYARTLGYKGEKPVLVKDGKVVSHRQVCWFKFCEKLRGC